MMSRSHPLMSSYVKSIAELRNEERRHLLYHYYMIHPLSMFNFWWRLIVCASLWTEYFFWPIVSRYYQPLNLQMIFSVHNIIYGMLIILNFFTGYYDQKKNRVVLNPTKVALKYLSGLFTFDLVAFGPVLVRLGLIGFAKWDAEDWRIIRILRFTLPMFKYARYGYYLEVLNEVKIYLHVNHFLFLVLKNIFNFMFILLSLNHIVFVVLQEFPAYRTTGGFKLSASVAEMLFLVDHGHLKPAGYITHLVTPIVCMAIGFLLHLIVHVYVMRIWLQLNSAQSIQSNVYNSIEAYLKYKTLPNEMREKIFLYIDFKYQKHYYKNSSIIQATSSALRQEVLVKMSRESTQKVDIFNKIPEDILKQLRARLVPVIYLPGDIIIQPGTEARNMYFILSGTVKVITTAGKEVYRLRDGANFGEISFVLDLPRVAYAVAATPCELYVLKQSHFFQGLREFPELLQEVVAMAKDRLAKIHTLDLQDAKEKEVAITVSQDDHQKTLDETQSHG